VQFVFLWTSGAPNSRAAPSSPHCGYATGFRSTWWCLRKP